MTYIPRNRLEEIKYTNGGEYMIEATQEEYVGYYYLMSNGNIFTGKNPSEGPSEPLVPIDSGRQRAVVSNERQRAVVSSPFTTGSERQRAVVSNERQRAVVSAPYKNDAAEKIKRYREIKPYYPIPSEKDYKRGYIVRYFSKRVNGGVLSIKEINKDTYKDIKNETGVYNDALYFVTSLFWKISGDLSDDLRNPSFPRLGILGSNKRALQSAEVDMRGISNYLTNLSEFARN